VEVQIIQICKIYCVFIIICLISSSLPSKESKYIKNKVSESLPTESGTYLSWIIAEKNGNFKKAFDLVSKTKSSLTEIDILKKAFFLSLNHGDWETTIFFAKRIDNLDSNFFFSKLVLATHEFITGDPKKSEQLFKKIDFSITNKKFINIILAWINFSFNNNPQILNEINGKEIRPENCSPLECLHSALLNEISGKTEKSNKFFEKLRINNQSYRILEILLVNYLEKKEIDSYKEILEKLKNENLSVSNFNNLTNIKKQFSPIENPNDGLAEVFLNIAGWFYENKIYDISSYFCNIGLKIRPDFYSLKFLLANVYEKLGYKEALLDFLNDSSQPNIYDLHLSKIKLRALNSLEKKDKSIQILKKLLKRNPDNNEVILILADSLRSIGKFKESIAYYDNVIEKIDQEDPRYWNIFYSRGISYERIKKWKLAERDFLLSLKLNPEAPYVLNYLGYSWLERKKNLKKALDLIKTASEIQPNDAYITDSLGWAYFLLGEYEMSIKILEHAIRMLPSDPTLNDHLGDAYWKVGRKFEAISQWKKVLVFKPNKELKRKVEQKIFKLR